jgi:hypothetical protein
MDIGIGLGLGACVVAAGAVLALVFRRIQERNKSKTS